ncbi:hypothetical protein PPACK8108_LOCUS14336 [Phakopsora pachyrhizi]|uniref:Uncharacterized protein n=1 Tax=Phakopsora pachyrhizi TaxID=170000 RepID=A0AAV0B4D6_PHAPC|nr:hypothetical protein PPACK8108_LOCUS14336 [Phakopsora pachyrhizi]
MFPRGKEFLKLSLRNSNLLRSKSKSVNVGITLQQEKEGKHKSNQHIERNNEEDVTMEAHPRSQTSDLIKLNRAHMNQTYHHSTSQKFGKGGQGKGGAERRIQWILVDFEEEGVAVGRNGWCRWKEEEKLGGGAYQGQSDWSRIKGAIGL